MSRIGYRQLPHWTFEISLAMAIDGGPAAAAGDFMFPWIATKKTYLHQLTYYIDTLALGAGALVTLEKFIRLARGDTSGGSVTLSAAVDLDAAVNGNIITSDMDLAARINAEQSLAGLANSANTTDLVGLNVSGLAVPAEINEGDGLAILVAGTVANVRTMAVLLVI